MKPTRKTFEATLQLIMGTAATTAATKAKWIPKAVKSTMYLKVARIWIASASLEDLSDPTGQGMGMIATLLVEGSKRSLAVLAPKFALAAAEQDHALEVFRMLIKRHKSPLVL